MLSAEHKAQESQIISSVKMHGRLESTLRGVTSYIALGHVPPPLELAQRHVHQLNLAISMYVQLQWAVRWQAATVNTAQFPVPATDSQS